jgi:hypothetical protein
MYLGRLVASTRQESGHMDQAIKRVRQCIGLRLIYLTGPPSAVPLGRC